MNAQQMLDAARKSNPDAPTGQASHGSTVVTWYRIGKRYEVGTHAVIVARGARSHILRYIDALLAGCVTAPDCEAWIAKRNALRDDVHYR